MLTPHPGNTLTLIKQIITRGGGVIATYKLDPKAAIPALILRPAQPTLADQIAAIDEAAEHAKAQLRVAYNVQGAGRPLTQGG